MISVAASTCVGLPRLRGYVGAARWLRRGACTGGPERRSRIERAGGVDVAETTWVRLCSRDEGSLRWRRAPRIGTHRRPTIARNETKHASLTVTMRTAWHRMGGSVSRSVANPSRHRSLSLGTEQNRRSTTQTLPTERKRHGLRPRITQRHDRNALTPAEPHPNHIDATASRGEPHGRATRRDRSSRDRRRLRQVVRVVPLAAHAVAVACSNHRRCSRARCAAGLRLECRELANERVTCSQCASCGAAVPDDRRLAVCRGACASATSGRKPSPESVRSHGRRTTVRPRALWHARRDRGCNTRFALSSEPPYAPRRCDSRRHCPKEIADE